MNIIPINDINAFNNLWPMLIEGFNVCLKYSEGDNSIESLYHDAVARKFDVNIVQLDGQYAGFFTTALVNRINAKKCLMINYMWLRSGLPSDSFIGCVHWMKTRMKELGCEQLHFYTLRDTAFTGRLKDEGFNKSYVQFVYKEV